MYLALYNVAGLAIFAWLLLIVLPVWKVTRWIAETAVFPVFLSVIYVLGIVPLLMQTGPGIMSDFGSAEGVTRLLANPDIALVAVGRPGHSGCRPMDSDDDGAGGTDSKLKITFSQDGDYHIHVRTVRQDGRGAYTLTVERN